MNEIESIEQMKLDVELMAVAKHVMDQNDVILRMNGRLLDLVANPVLVARAGAKAAVTGAGRTFGGELEAQEGRRVG